MQKSINLLFTVHDFTYLVILFNLNSEDPWVGMEASVQACSAMANTQEYVQWRLKERLEVCGPRMKYDISAKPTPRRQQK